MTARSAGTIWLGFAAISAGTAAATVAILGLAAAETGWLTPDGSIPAGCFASLVGSWIGAWPLARALGTAGTSGRSGVATAEIGKASLFRLAGTVLAGGTAALLGDWQRRSLGLAVAASYLVLLVAETGWLMNRLRSRSSQTLDSKIGDAQDGA